jgi:hypothetical protein
VGLETQPLDPLGHVLDLLRRGPFFHDDDHCGDAPSS